MKPLFYIVFTILLLPLALIAGLCGIKEEEDKIWKA